MSNIITYPMINAWVEEKSLTVELTSLELCLEDLARGSIASISVVLWQSISESMRPLFCLEKKWGVSFITVTRNADHEQFPSEVEWVLNKLRYVEEDPNVYELANVTLRVYSYA